MARRQSKAWDSETMGYGKHEYREIDPDTVNPDSFEMRGEQQYHGDVREENTAGNSKHPENDLTIDWASRVGTRFHTEAAGYEGEWEVSNVPVVKAPDIFIRATRVEEGSQEEQVPAVLLGITVDLHNMFAQVRTKITGKGRIGRSTREALTKHG